MKMKADGVWMASYAVDITADHAKLKADGI